MKNIFLGVLFSLALTSSTFAAGESNSVFQIVSFLWNENTQKLEFVGVGSGTSINSDDGTRQAPNAQGIITNKHVIESGNRIVDFVLLCPANDVTKSSQSIKCNIPAQVTAVHPDSDVAIVKPIADDFFLIPVPVVNYQNQYNDPIRLHGFPSVLEDRQNLGNNTIFEAFSKWNEEGGAIEAEGSNLTVTRGNVTGLFAQESKPDNIYYGTDAIGNFGLSGGAAFDKNGKYIGIPTLIDHANNTYILSYLSFRDWLNENISKQTNLDPQILEYYENTTKQTKTASPIPVVTTPASKTFIPEKQITASLSDLDLTTSVGVAAQYLFDQDIISGRPDGTFDGDAFVNRAEMAKFLMLATNQNISNTQKTPFSDIEANSWYEPYVERSYALEIINGYSDGTYLPSKTINTAEFLKMLSKAFRLTENTSYLFDDVEPSDWFSPYAGIAFQYRLFPSRNMTLLEPGKNMTRNEVAYALWVILQNQQRQSSSP